MAGIENGESSSKSSAFSVVCSHHKNISKVVLSCNGRLPAHILFALFDDMSFILSFLFSPGDLFKLLKCRARYLFLDLLL